MSARRVRLSLAGCPVGFVVERELVVHLPGCPRGAIVPLAMYLHRFHHLVSVSALYIYIAQVLLESSILSSILFVCNLVSDLIYFRSVEPSIFSICMYLYM